MAIEAFKVLVMEDNALIGRMYQMMFQGTVWSVTLTENGAEALEAFREHRNSGHPFDIVILDLDINGDAMVGLRVFEELKRADPDLRAILCSGSIDHAVYEKCVRIGFLATLRKPFTKPALQNLLHEILPRP